jgi:two-component system, response regulator YesN
MYRVLIADDEQLMRDALRIMISKVDGFSVVYSVDSGEEAVEICKTEKVDIVFMDIMMPGMSGIEASKRIYMHNPDITIYIVSAYNNFEFAIEALKAKVKEYISKPASYATIKALLDNYKENCKTYSKLFETPFSIIKERDFGKMYYQIPRIVDELYLYSGKDSELLKKKCLQLGQSLINSIEWLGGEQKECEELFPITDVLLTEKKSLEFWLFNVMNYVFQQISIKKHKLLKDVFEYIDTHIKEDISLNEIIDKCAVSQGYLSRIFKQQMNVSVMEYLHMRKLTLAKACFSIADLSIADVAFRLGYNESSYFSKVFKKYEHITVFQYKKNIGVTAGRRLENKAGDDYGTESLQVY